MKVPVVFFIELTETQALLHEILEVARKRTHSAAQPSLPIAQLRTASSSGHVLSGMNTDVSRTKRQPMPEAPPQIVLQQADEHAVRQLLNNWIYSANALLEACDPPDTLFGPSPAGLPPAHPNSRESPVNRDSVIATLMQRYALTRREAEVLHWLSFGKTNRDIADILGVSPRTINKHLEHIFGKLNVETRTAAAALALKTG
ncbi:response regulator transcription factor [Craterilacuibacter sinensis]|uniref:response regulator transcription factor n=1 Tax=Craterilacuibacter sinensis TaxID=2686017 RepID=UPI001F4562A2|nr:LuxR C-terminal-related transcriptional regulator [Craterilacuibacter sinensis]